MAKKKIVRKTVAKKIAKKPVGRPVKKAIEKNSSFSVSMSPVVRTRMEDALHGTPRSAYVEKAVVLKLDKDKNKVKIVK